MGHTNNPTQKAQSQHPCFSASSEHDKEMGKETARRASNRLGRVAKKSGDKPVKKTITKATAPREIRDARSTAVQDGMDGVEATDHKQASKGGKRKAGKVRRKKQRSLSQDKRAAKRKKESRKHIN